MSLISDFIRLYNEGQITSEEMFVILGVKHEEKSGNDFRRQAGYGMWTHPENLRISRCGHTQIVEEVEE